MTPSSLTSEELDRYARQIGPGVFSREGQLRLKNAQALVTRVGGMGGPASLALVMAGVGKVIIAHGGELISPDLNRQVLGSEAVLGKARTPHFAEYLRSMNRFTTVEGIDHEPDDDEARQLAEQVDTEGRAVVLTTTREHAELKRDQIHAYGKDAEIAECQGSMWATIEAEL